MADKDEALANYLLRQERQRQLWDILNAHDLTSFPARRQQLDKDIRDGLGNERAERYFNAPWEELKGPNPEFGRIFPQRQAPGDGGTLDNIKNFFSPSTPDQPILQELPPEVPRPIAANYANGGEASDDILAQAYGPNTGSTSEFLTQYEHSNPLEPYNAARNVADTHKQEGAWGVAKRIANAWAQGGAGLVGDMVSAPYHAAKNILENYRPGAENEVVNQGIGKDAFDAGSVIMGGAPMVEKGAVGSMGGKPPASGSLPERVYHGTTRDIEGGRFRYDPNDYMTDRALGVHFAKDPEVSNSFVMDRVNGRTEGPKEGGRMYAGEIDPKAKILDVTQKRYDNGALQSDQYAIQNMAAEAAFRKDPTLLQRYLEQARAMPTEQAAELTQRLVRGETVEMPHGEGPHDLGRVISNYGGKPMNDADRAAVANLARQHWIDQGYAGLRYQNTSPMEMATAKDPTSYLMFQPDTVRSPYDGGTLFAGGDGKAAGAVAAKDILEQNYALPMDQASRMARAKEMGFDTDKVWHHGSEKAGFAEFDPSLPSHSTSQPEGVFFTDHPWNAATYSGTKKKAEIIKDPEFNPREDGEPGNYQTYIRPGRQKVEDWEGLNWDEGPWGYDMNAATRLAKEEGYDSLLTKNITDEGPHGQGYNWGNENLVVFDPKNIRSTDAAFDPAQTNSTNLLAAGGNRKAAAGVAAKDILEQYGPKGEIPVTAATQYGDRVFKAPVHGMELDEARAALGNDYVNDLLNRDAAVQGFWTNRNRFVTREEATALAQAADPNYRGPRQATTANIAPDPATLDPAQRRILEQQQARAGPGAVFDPRGAAKDILEQNYGAPKMEAAIRFPGPDGKEAVFTGANHGIAYDNARAALGEDYVNRATTAHFKGKKLEDLKWGDNPVDGFVSNGQFYTRNEASAALNAKRPMTAEDVADIDAGLMKPTLRAGGNRKAAAGVAAKDILEQEYAKPERFLHGTTRDAVPSIRQNFLEPRTGDFVKDMYRNYGDLPEAVYMAPEAEPRHAVNAMKYHVGRKLDKHQMQLTPDEIREHGAMVVARPGEHDVWKMGDDQVARTRAGAESYDAPITAEPGDWYSHDAVQPTGFLTGERLLRFLRARGLKRGGQT